MSEVAETKHQEVTMHQLFKILGAQKKMTIREIASASGREQSTLSNMIKRGRPSVENLREVFEAIDEDLVLVFKNGQTFKLVP